mmetsp:Transcript_10447/g.13214  ORF Transcript_10447/g.13214 Transcript_10447/m.13214 type:complete len:215 (+) Transcript_10447:169-813(+)|eukprot:CAMPEP_0203639632 /NCGR_PEP_ID=MMETSP0088-20131115/5337_1 /ASSEMBLY_ACC=CAM_ASM_001087 /TAXON_ID=426623 /ORGANISM="Chaetoceros affinis, Strain CCMP159" /LENGTH=214 /DNA_ID=CAMNT_0050494579 /DNA_START=61 /DNA_END=705 /DNA_ORIENTATION=+
MKLFSILLLLPTKSLAFAPLSSSTLSSISVSASVKAAIDVYKKSTILYSSPFDDSPSPLQEDDLSEFDAYVPGTTIKIVTKDTVTGSGDISAEEDDVLNVSLVGKVLQNGNQFLENEDYTFELGKGNTFPGFNDGLLGSKVGTKRTIKVPPNKAYGKKGAKGIPPMSDLIFEVEVKAIARGQVDRVIAKIGTDRLLGFAILIAFLAISPFLPTF